VGDDAASLQRTQANGTPQDVASLLANPPIQGFGAIVKRNTFSILAGEPTHHVLSD
jgi:hypothetical protein